MIVHLTKADVEDAKARARRLDEMRKGSRSALFLTGEQNLLGQLGEVACRQALDVELSPLKVDSGGDGNVDFTAGGKTYDVKTATGPRAHLFVPSFNLRKLRADRLVHARRVADWTIELVGWIDTNDFLLFSKVGKVKVVTAWVEDSQLRPVSEIVGPEVQPGAEARLVEAVAAQNHCGGHVVVVDLPGVGLSWIVRELSPAVGALAQRLGVHRGQVWTWAEVRLLKRVPRDEAQRLAGEKLSQRGAVVDGDRGLEVVA